MRRNAVIAHGSGSRAEFAVRAFAPALAAVGYGVIAVEDRSGDVDRVAVAINRAVERSGADVVGGISVGAHAAALWASGRSDLSGVLLAMPAWTGEPGEVAGWSAVAADRVERHGRDEVIAEVHRDYSRDWVVDELARAWSDYADDTLAAALRATAHSRGPTAKELGCITAPVGVVAVDDDPLHPAVVARSWVAELPYAGLVVLPRRLPACGVVALGHAAVTAWQDARAARG